MNVTVEKLEKGMAKLTITVTADVVAEAEDKVYKRQKNQISIPGFRKGKAPKKIIEKMYGEGVFLSDAINDVINETYPDAVKECGEEIVSNPKIDLSQAEPGKDLVYTAEKSSSASTRALKSRSSRHRRFPKKTSRRNSRDSRTRMPRLSM